MPKVVLPVQPLPQMVLIAVEAFGSALRVELIRHFLHTPSTQADAARALGVNHQIVSDQARALLELGILVAAGESNRRRILSVDEERLDRALQALSQHVGRAPTSAGTTRSS